MRLLFLLSIIMLPVYSWAQSQRQSSPSITQEFVASGPSNTPTSGGDYRIGQDDLVEISIFEVPDLNTTSRVTASGSISMPLLGPLEVAGRTALQVERFVEESLRTK